MSNREARTLSVPEGVAGERIDSALTRVLGLSRTAVVKLLEDGDITTGGKPMPKSDRVTAGQVIEVLMPEPINSDPIPLTPLDGLSIVYDDSDIVVIDKPITRLLPELHDDNDDCIITNKKIPSNSKNEKKPNKYGIEPFIAS